MEMEREAPAQPDSMWGLEALTFNMRDGFVGTCHQTTSGGGAASRPALRVVMGGRLVLVAGTRRAPIIDVKEVTEIRVRSRRGRSHKQC